MDKLILTFDEYHQFEQVCQKELKELLIKKLDNGVEVSFDHATGQKCFDLVVNALQYNGFDCDYNPTQQGKLYETIIDKITEL